MMDIMSYTNSILELSYNKSLSYGATSLVQLSLYLLLCYYGNNSILYAFIFQPHHLCSHNILRGP